MYKLLIACENIRPEMEFVIRETGVQLKKVYLDKDLHRHPERIRANVERVLANEEVSVDLLLLGYGLCSNAVVGLKSDECSIVVPKTHDCIGLYLGSLKRYMKIFNEAPGTYYLTPGWIESYRDPISIMKMDYEPRVGADSALEAINQEMRHYTRMVFIDTGVREDTEKLRERARENARYFGKEYREIKGDLKLMRKLVSGPYKSNEFVYVEKGEKIEQRMFF